MAGIDGSNDPNRVILPPGTGFLHDDAVQFLVGTQPSTGNGAGNGAGGTVGNIGGGTGGIPNDGGGGTGGTAAKGIGLELIGNTASSVEDPARRVSDFLLSNTLPGLANGHGYGKGGRPK